MELTFDQIYNIYNTRADCENRIKELKYDFGADNFCLKDFYATEASFRFIMMAYNIMALFKHEVVNSNMMLSTLRSYCFLKESASTGIRILDNRTFQIKKY
ncbi:transposase [Aliarcobacter cryaerophilus]|uniref:transposase n=1 Tax=Aliarcobacter cryaerophilus TaxID=28198 RepID=UPI0036F4481A